MAKKDEEEWDESWSRKKKSEPKKFDDYYDNQGYDLKGEELRAERAGRKSWYHVREHDEEAWRKKGYRSYDTKKSSSGWIDSYYSDAYGYGGWNSSGNSGFTWKDDSKVGNQEDMYHALKAALRACNAPLHSGGGKEKEVKVFWSGSQADGEDSSTRGTKAVFEALLVAGQKPARASCLWEYQVGLDPDVHARGHALKDGLSLQNKTDIACGEALAKSQACFTCDVDKAKEAYESLGKPPPDLSILSPEERKAIEKSWLKSNGASKRQITLNHLLFSVEESVAEEEILSQYPGFEGYLAAYRQYYLDDAFHEKMKKARPERQFALAAVRYHLTFPGEAMPDLSHSPRLDDVVKRACGTLDKAETPAERVYACVEAERIINELDDDDEKKKAPNAGGAPCGMPESGSNNPAKISRQEGTPSDPDYIEEGSDFPEEVMVVKAQETNRTRHDYKKHVADLRGEIKRMRSRLFFRAEEAAMYERPSRSGGLDEGSLHKLYTEPEDPRCFERKEIISRPKMAIGILVDESGSMSSDVGPGLYRYRVAMNAMTVMAEALKDIPGIQMALFGHAAQTSMNGSAVDVYDIPKGAIVAEYFTPEGGSIACLTNISARGNNADGHAINYCAKRMDELFPGEERHLFVISDGQPASSGYGGEPAFRHMNYVCKKARKRGTNVFAIGVIPFHSCGRSSSHESSDVYGEKMYGKGNYLILPNPRELGVVLGNLVTRVCMKQAASV